MLFQTDIDKINVEIAQLQELIAAKQQRQSQLVHLQNIADEAVKSVQNVICLLSSPDARVTLKSAVIGLFDGMDDSSDTTLTPSATALVSVLEPEAASLVAAAPTSEDFSPESAASLATEPATPASLAAASAPEPELIQVTELVSYMREADGEIQCTYVGFNNKSKAQSWGEWLTSSIVAMASRFEVKPATKLPFKHELHVWGLNLNQVNKLAEQDFSKTPKAGFSASRMVSKTRPTHPTKVAPQLEHLEPGDLVGSLLIPGWTYRVVEVRPNGQLNCKRLLSSGESFNVDLDINGVYLVEKAAYVAPEPEPAPELLADAPINARHTQAPQSESPEEAPTAAKLEEPMTPEKLASFIRAAWSWEEIEAITASNEQYKKAAWSLLTQKEKDQVLALKLQSQQKDFPNPEPEPPSTQSAVEDFQEGDEVEVTSKRHGEERVGEKGIVKVVNNHGLTVESSDGNLTYWYPEELKLLCQSIESDELDKPYESLTFQSFA